MHHLDDIYLTTHLLSVCISPMIQFSFYYIIYFTSTSILSFLLRFFMILSQLWNAQLLRELNCSFEIRP